MGMLPMDCVGKFEFIFEFKGKREIGSRASWSLSSCKTGFGVEQLRDDSLETYWQSDGPQPHYVTIQVSFD